MPHATLQEHLYGRYYLSPSQLYSVIRLSRDGAMYDVPVEGDWITIAVVAERGDIRVSGAKEDIHSDDEEEDETGNKKVKQGDKPKDKETRSKEQWKKRRGPRKYINLRMCSLPPKRPGTSESSGGDALLQLLLFESDATVHSVADGEKKYRGGSGGAYEKWCNLTAGCVVAILNPRVLRPLKVSRTKMTDTELAVGSSCPSPLDTTVGLESHFRRLCHTHWSRSRSWSMQRDAKGWKQVQNVDRHVSQASEAGLTRLGVRALYASITFTRRFNVVATVEPSSPRALLALDSPRVPLAAREAKTSTTPSASMAYCPLDPWPRLDRRRTEAVG